MAESNQLKPKRHLGKELLAAVWVVAFLSCFFWQDLPNNGVSRGLLWNVIADDWLTILNPLDYSAKPPAEVSSGWKHFEQRIPVLWPAGLLLISAAGLGTLSLRLLPASVGLMRAEQIVVVLGLGLSAQSLWILSCGLGGQLSAFILLLPGVASWIVWVCISWRAKASGDRKLSVRVFPPRSQEEPLSRRLRLILGGIIAAFSLHIFLGGMTPPFDFDVREYHLQGPREWFQAGRIFTLEHNVYTSFPFLSEMLSLGTMVLMDDWSLGAIAGKLLLTTFQFLSALAVFAIASRWLGNAPAWIAAVAFLSTPWTVRISIIAYAEGALTFYLIASVMLGLLAINCRDSGVRQRLIAITGFAAGSAMAAKYPGVLSVILPVSLTLLCRVIQFPAAENAVQDSDPDPDEHTLARQGKGVFRAVLSDGGVFLAGVVLAVGLWLLKNLFSTGNPAYPLAYRVFGASDWSPAMDAKWKAAHSASEHSLSMVPEHLADVAVRNDWQNGLLFALAVPALQLVKRSLTVRLLWLHAAWMLGTWWLLTHRIDRFWVPVLPLLAVLAGSAWKLSSTLAWRSVLLCAVFVCCIFNYGFSRLSVIGFHAGLMDFQAARDLPVRQDIRTLNSVLPESAKVLMVGEAEVFDAEFDLVYNTVFDESIFQQWTSADRDDVPAGEQELKPAEEIRSLLAARGITHLYVNWSEILRYRLTYGYTEFVVPERFIRLQEMGVIQEAVVLSAGQLSKLKEQQQQQLQSWPGFESLKLSDDVWASIQLFQVQP